MPAQLYRCASCGALMPRHALTATQPEGGGRRLWMCLDRQACRRRNESNVNKPNRTGA